LPNPLMEGQVNDGTCVLRRGESTPDAEGVALENEDHGTVPRCSDST
jgi:hypothetical protein